MEKIGYHDEIAWPHMLLNTLDDLPNKWYNIEESRGETFNWKTLKENLIKDLSFSTTQDHLKEAKKRSYNFIKPSNRLESDDGTSSNHHLILIHNNITTNCKQHNIDFQTAWI